jgi:hypothetical protein
MDDCDDSQENEQYPIDEQQISYNLNEQLYTSQGTSSEQQYITEQPYAEQQYIIEQPYVEQQYINEQPYVEQPKKQVYTLDMLKSIDPMDLSYEEIFNIYSNTVFVKPPPQPKQQPIYAPSQPTPYMRRKQEEKNQQKQPFIAHVQPFNMQRMPIPMNQRQGMPMYQGQMQQGQMQQRQGAPMQQRQMQQRQGAPMQQRQGSNRRIGMNLM